MGSDTSHYRCTCSRSLHLKWGDIMKSNFETVVGVMLGGVGLFFGNDAAVLNIIYALFVCIGFDIMTGAIKASYNKAITSKKWIDGFVRKILMVMCVSFCYFLDTFGILNLGVSLESAAALFFIAGEVFSVFENFVEMGVKMPPVLVSYLDKYDNDQEENGTDGK
jgi:toxin secretion/phage lysis holin